MPVVPDRARLRPAPAAAARVRRRRGAAPCRDALAPRAWSTWPATACSLSQLLRRAGRVRLPVPSPRRPARRRWFATPAPPTSPPRKGTYLASAGSSTPRRLHDRFGYNPRYTTAEAVDAFVSGGPPRRPARERCAARRVRRCWPGGAAANGVSASPSPARSARGRHSVDEARVIPLHGDAASRAAQPSSGAVARAGRRRRHGAPLSTEPAGLDPAGLAGRRPAWERKARRRARLPAPPPRRATTPSTSSASTPI